MEQTKPIPTLKIVDRNTGFTLGYYNLDKIAEDARADVYRYKGTVQTYEELPMGATNEVGDVYNVVEKHGNTPAGTNYAWNGTEWDALGGEIDFSHIDEDIAKLMDTVFPITLSMSLAKSGSNHRITYGVTESGAKYIPDELTLTQTNYGTTTTTTTHADALDKLKSASGNTAYIDTPIVANRTTFSLVVASAGRTGKSTSTTRYICYSGGSTKTELTEADVANLTEAYATGVAFNPKVSTKNNEYIWLLIPNNLTINKVTSAGFDVTLDSTVRTVATALGTFKAYRTLNPLTQADWSLVIS